MEPVQLEWETPLHEGQQAIWDGFILNPDIKRAVITTGRQTGKTTLAKRASIHWAISHPGSEIGWITPETKHSLKVFNWMKENMKAIASFDSINRVVKFNNGSTIYFYSVENYDSIRGSTFHYRILDEAAFGRFSQPQAIEAYDPTFIAKGIKDLHLSTPKGKNRHYDNFMRALRSPTEFAYSMKTEDNPMVDKEWLALRKQELPASIYQQEYEGLFVEGSSEVFGDFLEHCTIKSYKDKYNGRAYLGVDIALGGEDMTTAILLSTSGTVLNKFEWRESNTEKQIDKIKAICSTYDIHRGFIEINTERGIQQAVNVKFHRIKDWMTTRKNKPVMIQNLKHDIEEGIIKLPTPTLDHILYNELSSFQGVTQPDGYVKYGHPVGGHDDSVIALALANEARVNNRHGVPFNPIITQKSGTRHLRPTHI